MVENLNQRSDRIAPHREDGGDPGHQEGRRPADHNARGEASLLALISRLGSELQLLLRQECDLAKTELEQKATEAKRGLLHAALGTVIFAIAIPLVLLAVTAGIATGFAALGFSLIASVAIGFAITAILSLTAAAIVWSRASKLLSPENLKLKETKKSIQATTEWAKTKLHHLS
ncbi:MAG: phage holin family protein [Verrucomicrobiales bacterium]|nr:phage holin family protein [Verrucomicrobiales bacterium]